MAIIYLACAKANRNNQDLYIIRSETVFDNSELDIAVHNEITPTPAHAKTRKLQEVERIFTVHKSDFAANERVTIFCDDDEMARDWISMLEGREDEVQNVSAWHHMFRTIGQRKFTPEFLARGLLSVSIRDDAKKFLLKNGVFE